jgi:predicted transposase YdaD
MNISRTPHNDFFYQVMSRKDKATAFFKRYLPASVLDMADLTQLELVESKHISDQGLTLYNDVLYKCPLEGNQIGYFFGVCEHQSTPEDQMPLRLLKYDLSIIEDHLKHNSHFPAVINTVLYHGKAPWNYSTAFTDYYSNPTLGGQFLYMAPFTLINIPTQPLEVIYQDKELGFCFLAFQCTSTADPYQSFAKAMQSPIFAPYFKSLSKEEKNIVLRYLGQCINRKQYSLENLVNLVTDNNQEKEELMQSIAQPYIEQGIQQGIQQGIETEKMYIAKSMLKKGFDINSIKEITGLNLQAIEKLKQE